MKAERRHQAADHFGAELTAEEIGHQGDVSALTPLDHLSPRNALYFRAAARTRV